MSEKCFVCDSEFNKTGKTEFSRVDVAHTIRNLLGGKYLVVINEDDQLCWVCVSLVSRVARLEKMLSEANSMLFSLMRAKYSLDSEEITVKNERTDCSDEEGDHGKCFICDKQLKTSDIVSYEREDVAQVISKILEGEYLITIGSDDFICCVCMSLTKRIHRLETELLPSNNSLYSLLGAKYSISSLQSKTKKHIPSSTLATTTNQNKRQTAYSITANKIQMSSNPNLFEGNSRKRVSFLNFDSKGRKHLCDNEIAAENIYNLQKVKENEENCTRQGYKFLNETSLKHLDKEKVTQRVVNKNLRNNNTKVSININIGNEKTVGVNCTVKSDNDGERGQRTLKLDTHKKIFKLSGNKKQVIIHKSKLNISSYYCGGCDFKSTTFNELCYHMKYPNPSFSCQICEIEFHSQLNLKVHCSHHSAKSEQRICRHCGQSIHDQKHYDTHYWWTHRNTDQQVLLCTDCYTGFLNKAGLKLHQKLVHKKDDSYTCDGCSLMFSDPVKLMKHVKFDHCNQFRLKNRRQSPYKHDILSQHAKQQQVDIKHEKNSEKSKRTEISLISTIDHSYQISPCSEEKLRNQFIEPKEAKNVPKWLNQFQFNCTKCGKRFMTEQYLQQHVVSECMIGSQSISYPCEQCSETFNSVNTLKHHMVISHAEPLLYACDICDKRFHSQSRVLQHKQQMHRAGFVFTCKDCDQGFNSDSAFAQHMIQAHEDYSVLEELSLAQKHILEIPSV